MGDSLRNQLLKQGLVTKKQAKAAKHAEILAARERRERAGGSDAAELEAARKELEEKAARDKELNRQREEERAEAARIAEALDLIRKNKVKPESGEVAYHFPDGNKVRKIQVSKAQQQALGIGKLAIVEEEGKYVLLPEAAAEKLLERAPELVVCFKEPPGADGDDPYAEHPVPDDLMW